MLVPDGEIKLSDLATEIPIRKQLLEEYLRGLPCTQLHSRYVGAWCLSYSSRYTRKRWPETGRTQGWWDDFTLQDAMEYERGRRLVKILREAKRAGKKPLILTYYQFHQQLAAKVLSCFFFSKNYK